MKMKKLFITCTLFTALLAGVYGLYINAKQHNAAFINATLAKLEALAQSEGAGGGRVECQATAICKSPATGADRGYVTCFGYQGENCTQGTELDGSIPGVIWSYVKCGTRKYSCKDKGL